MRCGLVPGPALVQMRLPETIPGPEVLMAPGSLPGPVPLKQGLAACRPTWRP